MSHDSSSVDSELAALLDEELFGKPNHHAAAAAAASVGAADAAPEQQCGSARDVQHSQPKRARLESPEHPASSEDEPEGSSEEPEPHEDVSCGPPCLPSAHVSSVCPPHPAWLWDLCIRCGAQRPAPDIQQAMPNSNGHSPGQHAAASVTRIKHLHNTQALEVSAHEAARIASGSLQRLVAARQLVLVLDLDHTLLNTVRDADLVGKERAAAIEQLKKQQQQQQQQARQSEGGEAAVPGSSGPGAGSSTQPGPAAAAAATGGSSANGSAGLCRPLAELYHFPAQGLWTKLRPGVGAFLAAVSRLAELHIYTMGDKGYAGLMADVLDPQHRLFVGRVVSASDSTRAGVKDLDVLLADDSLVLILDDTENVWEKHRANLIQVERYHYFGASARLFHPNTLSSPLELGSDEPVAGGVLDNAAQLLARIHARVYGPPPAAAAAAAAAGGGGEAGADSAQQQQQQLSGQDEELLEQQQQQQQQSGGVRRVVRRVKQQQQQQRQAPADAAGGTASQPGRHGDVRDCLEEERQSILAGCSVTFSRVIAQGQALPQDNPLWQLVERLGGSCTLDLARGVTTHLVVKPDKDNPGAVPLTDKVRAAHAAGVPIVHPDWVTACSFAWKRLPEAPFGMPPYRNADGAASRMLAAYEAGRSKAAAAAAERAAAMAGAGRVTSRV